MLYKYDNRLPFRCFFRQRKRHAPKMSNATHSTATDDARIITDKEQKEQLSLSYASFPSCGSLVGSNKQVKTVLKKCVKAKPKSLLRLITKTTDNLVNQSVFKTNTYSWHEAQVDVGEKFRIGFSFSSDLMIKRHKFLSESPPVAIQNHI